MNVALCATSTAAPHTSEPRAPHIPAQQCTTSTTVLLATAQVAAYDRGRKKHLIRVLLDSASQSNFITKDCCDRLGIGLEFQHTVVRGFGGSEKNVSGSVNFEFASRYNANVQYNVSSLVVDQITDHLPTALIDKTALPYLEKIPLADDLFATPNKIDALIGASLFPHLLLRGVVNAGTATPPAIETTLGYVVMGSAPVLHHGSSPLTTCCYFVGLDTLVQRSELEEVNAPSPELPDDAECEDFYRSRSTTVRDPATGRSTVVLPFRDDVFSLGGSHEATSDFTDKQYISPAPPDDSQLPAYVIPKHGEIRQDKAEVGIVLDTSSATTSGRSLLMYQFVPYHALRTVQQLIEDDGAMYSLASKVASTPLYVDDIAFSMPCVEEGATAAKELVDLFTGLRWSTDAYAFYLVVLPPEDTRTERAALSTVSRLWAFMGFVAPAILFAKLSGFNSHPVVTGVESSALHEPAKRTSSWRKLLRVIFHIRRAAKLLPRRNFTAVTADFHHTAPLFSLPAPAVESINTSLLHRLLLLDKLIQFRWERWLIGYLHGLQVRQKCTYFFCSYRAYLRPVVRLRPLPSQ